MQSLALNESANIDDVPFSGKTNSLPVLGTVLPPVDTLITNEIVFIQDVTLSFCLIPLLCVLGMVGNSFNMMVLWGQGFQRSTDVFLFSLSISDFLFSFFNILYRFKNLIPYFDKNVGTTVKTFSYVVIYPIINIFLCSSLLHVTVIAIERCAAVFFPFYVSRIFTPFRVKWAVLFVNIFTFSLIMALFFYYSYEWVYDTRYNVTIAVISYSHFYINYTEFFNVYLGIVLNNVLCMVPLAIILLCSLAISIKLNIDTCMGAQINSTKSKQQNVDINFKVVRTLLCVCLVHLVVFLPTVIIDVYRNYVMITFFSGNSIYLISNVNYTLYQCNASVNFIIYVITSSKFGKVFKRSFSCSMKCCRISSP